MAKLSAEKRRIRRLESALGDQLAYLAGHECPYCGTEQCEVSKAVKVLEDKAWNENG